MMQHFMPPGASEMPPEQPQLRPQQVAAAPGEPHALAGNLDPNNAIQREILQRASKLSEQETAAFAQGCSPQAAAVLKKILPEIGFLIDAVLGGQPGSAPPAPMQQPSGAPGALPPAASSPSGLRRFG